MEKCCKECPWIVRNKNNDSIVNHSKKWDKKHNCHMLINGTNKKLWEDNPEFQCVGNRKNLISTTNIHI